MNPPLTLRVDHTDEAQVKQLIARIEQEHASTSW